MNHKEPKRRGVTLIELLVVIGIMMMLAAVVLPRLNLGSDSNKVREASRMVSTYLSVARNQAIETGRPCGVLFERVDARPNASVQMVLVKEPAPYAGDTMDCQVTIDSNAATFSTPATASISLGDLIQFDFQGPWYPINGVTDGTEPNTIASVTFNIPTGTPSRPLDHKTLPFQIRRQPVSDSGQTIRSMTPPQRLPRGVAVDLTASGVDANYFDGGGNVAIMFDSNGSVHAVHGLGGGGSTKVVTPIYLLVGEEMQVPKDPEETVKWYISNSDLENADKDEIPNWQSPNSRWVVVSPGTGIATVAVNAGSSNWTSDGSETEISDEVQKEAIPKARNIASQGLDGGDRR